jgi:hypothetical protein
VKSHLISAASTLFGWTSGAWGAAAAWATFAVAVVAAWIALVQLVRARKLSEEQGTAYVIVRLESSEVGREELELVIRNIGSTPAFNVSIDITPPMVRAQEIAGVEFMNAKALTQPIRMLAPGQEIRLYFDTAGPPARASMVNEFEAKVNGFNYRGKPLREATFVLDADWGLGGMYPRLNNLHYLGFRAKGIDDNLKTIADGMKVLVKRTAPPPEK